MQVHPLMKNAKKIKSNLIYMPDTTTEIPEPIVALVIIIAFTIVLSAIMTIIWKTSVYLVRIWIGASRKIQEYNTSQQISSGRYFDSLNISTVNDLWKSAQAPDFSTVAVDKYGSKYLPNNFAGNAAPTDPSVAAGIASFKQIATCSGVSETQLQQDYVMSAPTSALTCSQSL